MALTKAAEPVYGIARLIGEGYGKPEGKDETPIDIQYAKIAEWLVILSTRLLVHVSHCCRVGHSLHDLPVYLNQVCSKALHKSLLCRVSGSTCQLTGGSGCKPFRQQQQQKQRACLLALVSMTP